MLKWRSNKKVRIGSGFRNLLGKNNHQCLRHLININYINIYFIFIYYIFYFIHYNIILFYICFYLLYLLCRNEVLLNESILQLVVCYLPLVSELRLRILYKIFHYFYLFQLVKLLLQKL
jgi:hypothetical protein